MNTKSRFVLFSIERPGKSNRGYKEYVESILSKHGFKKVLGSYKGVLEKSYMVLANEDKALNDVLTLAQKFDQESVLIVDENRVATLQYLDSILNVNSSHKLGRWTSIDALEAKNLDNWTLDGTNYYSVA